MGRRLKCGTDISLPPPTRRVDQPLMWVAFPPISKKITPHFHYRTLSPVKNLYASTQKKFYGKIQNEVEFPAYQSNCFQYINKGCKCKSMQIRCNETANWSKNYDNG